MLNGRWFEKVFLRLRPRGSATRTATGIFSLVKRTYEGETEPVTSLDNKAPAFWDYAGARGLKSTVVNVPLTYPPGPVQGALVTGLFTPSDSPCFTYPEHLTNEIRDRFSGYHPAPFSNVEKSEAFIQEMIRFTETGTQMENWLAAGTNPDIRIRVIQATDILQHFLLLW